MNILMCFDNASCPMASVTMSSLISNYTGNINFYVLYDNISLLNRIILSRYIKYKNKSIAFYKVDKDDYNDFPIPKGSSYTKETYFRILAPKYLPKNIDKILYLDTDIIVRGDLSFFDKFDLGDYPYAAIKEWTIFHEAKKNALGVPYNRPFFQCGVMFINLNKWRENEYHIKIPNFISKLPPRILELVDQDALNSYFRGYIKEIPLKYNVASQFFLNNKSGFLWNRKIRYSVEEIAEAINDIRIIHFTSGGKSKPWHVASNIPCAGWYLEYMKDTPYWRSHPIHKIYKDILNKSFGNYKLKKYFIFLITRFLKKNSYLIRPVFFDANNIPRKGIFKKYFIIEIKKGEKICLQTFPLRLSPGNYDLQIFIKRIVSIFSNSKITCLGEITCIDENNNVILHSTFDINNKLSKYSQHLVIVPELGNRFIFRLVLTDVSSSFKFKFFGILLNDKIV